MKSFVSRFFVFLSLIFFLFLSVFLCIYSLSPLKSSIPVSASSSVSPTSSSLTRTTSSEPSFDVCYPAMLPFPLFTTSLEVYSPNSSTSGYYTNTVSFEVIELTSSQGVWSDDSVQQMNFIDNSVYAVIFYTFNGESYSYSEATDLVGICYYGVVATVQGDGLYFSDYPSSLQSATFYRATSSMVEDSNLTYNPFTTTNTINFDGFNWFAFLSSFGEDLLVDSALVDFLTFQIGDYTLLSLLVNGGFVIFAGWIVLKFVVPS